MNCQAAIVLPRRIPKLWLPLVKKRPRIVGDLSGNLKLKNIGQPTPTTSGPASQSMSYATIAEMTQTITTKGNKVILTFSASVIVAVSGHGNCTGAIAFFRDGSQVGPTFIVTVIDTGLPEQTPCLTYIDSPTAASHTYTVQWKCVTNTTAGIGNDTTARSFQAVELG